MPHTHQPQPPEPHTPQPQQASARPAHPALDPPSQDTPAAYRPPWRDAAVEKAASGDRPLLIALVGLIGLLLGIPMYLINDEVDEIEHKVEALEEKIDARFAQQDEKIDAKFASLERDVGEINLRLTALIAALNATDAVNAALEGGSASNSARSSLGVGPDQPSTMAMSSESGGISTPGT